MDSTEFVTADNLLPSGPEANSDPNQDRPFFMACYACLSTFTETSTRNVRVKRLKYADTKTKSKGSLTPYEADDWEWFDKPLQGSDVYYRHAHHFIPPATQEQKEIFLKLVKQELSEYDQRLANFVGSHP